MRKFLVIIFMAVVFSGCQSVQRSRQADSSDSDQKALTAIAGSLAGKELTEQDLRRLNRQMNDNADVKEAVDSITNAVKGQKRVMYCPLTGKRYAGSLTVCPEHGIPLNVVGE